jgi:ferredoxin
MELVVDPSRCVGAGMCALTAPAYFDQDEDGHVQSLKAVDVIDDSVRRAADFCPSGAVAIFVDGKSISDRASVRSRSKQ